MNRTIKFRGLRTDGKGWVYGDLLCNWTIHQILSEDDGNEYKVIPESVGQFTGLHDKNGVEIYDGDILLHTGTNQCDLEVHFKSGAFFGKGVFTDCIMDMYLNAYDFESIEIIGNIHTDTNSK